VNDWDRLPDESGLWYGRFDLYRLAGTGRGVDAAYRLATGKEGRAGASWWNACRQWRWQERAEAWDVAERDRFRAEEEERRRAARERRLYLLGEARESSWKAILAGNLSELSQEESRSMLGSLRLLFMESLKGERLELGEPTEIVGDLDVVQFRADELARAENELQEWREKRRESNG
jgi:hypothetical protein